jgi:hypothetical protein
VNIGIGNPRFKWGRMSLHILKIILKKEGLFMNEKNKNAEMFSQETQSPLPDYIRNPDDKISTSVPVREPSPLPDYIRNPDNRISASTPVREPSPLPNYINDVSYKFMETISSTNGTITGADNILNDDEMPKSDKPLTLEEKLSKILPDKLDRTVPDISNTFKDANLLPPEKIEEILNTYNGEDR